MFRIDILPDHVADFAKAAVSEMVVDRGRRLLFLSVQGSRLFGLESASSDWDLKGVYAPAPGELLRGNNEGASRPVAKSTGGDGKNTAMDVDIQLWPVHFWLPKLKSGEGTSLDLFWSHGAEDMVVYCDPAMWGLFDNHERVVRVVAGRQNSFAGFAERHASVYSAKSRHFEMVSSCLAMLEKLKTDLGKGRYSETLLSAAVDNIRGITGGDPEYFELLDPDTKETLERGQENRCNGQPVLRFCKKSMHLTAKLPYFEEFLRARVRKYGHRTREAAQGGIDLKAYCHAYRAWRQLESILDDGRLTYPVPGAGTARAIKFGHLSPDEVRAEVSAAREAALAKEKTYQGDFDERFCDRFIMSLYGM